VRAVQRQSKPRPDALRQLYAEPFLVYLVRTLLEDEPSLSFIQAFQRAQQRLGVAA
jgi:hypothetical protein